MDTVPAENISGVTAKSFVDVVPSGPTTSKRT
jgi:hypothetical protein